MKGDFAIVVRSVKPSDIDLLTNMIRAYYREDQGIEVPSSNIEATLTEFAANPIRGRVEILEHAGRIAGYALLVTYWSNEYSGTILFIDELYVKPEFRRQGLGRTYIEKLIDQPPYDAVAIQLEVTPENKRAQALYERLGFVEYPDRGMIYKERAP